LLYIVYTYGAGYEVTGNVTQRSQRRVFETPSSRNVQKWLR